MRQPSWSHMRRQAIWAGAIALCAAPLPAVAMTTAHASGASTVAAQASAADKKGPTSIRGFNTATVSIKAGSVVTDQVRVLPRQRRDILVQARRPGSTTFATQLRGHSSAKGLFTAAYAPKTAGTWRFRLVVLPNAHRKGVRSAIRKVNVTQQASVTGLEFTALTRTSVSLAWINPSDDFTGVTIRRADGPIPPVTATDGTPVAEVDSPENTFVDLDLTPGTQYSYAVFAHDGALPHHVAVGATLTISTRTPGTDAVLKVNPLIPNGDNVTIGTEVAFDGSDSLPADGTTVASWSVDYGDGVTDSFPNVDNPGPFDPVQLNTSHTYNSNGPRTVTLSVTDSDGNSASDTITVQVFNAPTVSLSVQDISPTGLVTFDVNAQTPGGTEITSWEMAVSGDEVFFLPDPGTPPGAPPATLEVPFGPGTYTIDFMITNNAGATVFAVPVDLVVP